MSGSPLLTVADVAARLQVTDEAVRRWLRQGRLRGSLPGGKKTGYRIPEAELERFLAATSNRAAAE